MIHQNSIPCSHLKKRLKVIAKTGNNHNFHERKEWLNKQYPYYAKKERVERERNLRKLPKKKKMFYNSLKKK